MTSVLREVMERGGEEMEGPSHAGDALVAWPTLWPLLRHEGEEQEKQHRRGETCPCDTAGINEHTGHSRVCHGAFPFT